MTSPHPILPKRQKPPRGVKRNRILGLAARKEEALRKAVEGARK